MVVAPDIHFPHQDKHALACFLTAVRALRPRSAGFLGDMLDCQGWSQHPVRSHAEERAQTFYEAEVRPAQELLAETEKHCDEMWMDEGNHEQRVQSTIVRLGGVLKDLEDLVSPRKLLAEGRKKPWTWVPYIPEAQTLSHYKIADDLLAIHGWTWCKHAAAKHLEQAKNYSIIHGHTHRKQSFYSRDPITGKVYQAWSPGCLSKLQPLYQTNSPTDWVHGFSLIWVTDDKQRWTSYSPVIDRGVCVLPDGRKIDGFKEKVL